MEELNIGFSRGLRRRGPWRTAMETKQSVRDILTGGGGAIGLVFGIGGTIFSFLGKSHELRIYGRFFHQEDSISQVQREDPKSRC